MLIGPFFVQLFEKNETNFREMPSMVSRQKRATIARSMQALPAYPFLQRPG